MKTSVIEVCGVLSASGAPGLKRWIGKVAGVENVTRKYAAGGATVRSDKTGR